MKLILDDTQIGIMNKALAFLADIRNGDVKSMFKFLPLETQLPITKENLIINIIEEFMDINNKNTNEVNLLLEKIDKEYTNEELVIISSATDLLARVATGQWREIEKDIPKKDGICVIGYKEKDIIGKIISKQTISNVDGWSSNLGIYNPATDNDARIAFEIHQVIRHYLSWERAIANGDVERGAPRNWDKMMGVSFDEPSSTSGHPLPKLIRDDISIPILESKPKSQPR